MIYEYGEIEVEYLRKKDKRLREIIDKIGIVERTVYDDVFTAVVRGILGQQVSVQAQETVFKRLILSVGEITPENISKLTLEELQSKGTTFRKAEYILNFTDCVMEGVFVCDKLNELSDDEIINELSKIKGIGVWTAEMLLISALQRPDILSYGDLAIRRGLRMVYHHKEVTKEMFERYRKRYSPYGTVASIYLWAVAEGAIPEMKDYGGKGKRK